MIRKNGFEEVTRNMVENLSHEFKDFKIDIKAEFGELRETNTTLYNHLSKRLPPWATAFGAVAMMIIGSIVGLIISGGKI